MTPLPIPAFVNPGAGTGENAARVLGPDPRFDVRATPPDELAHAVAEEVARGAPRVLVAGGDGTLATAAGALAHTEAELAVLPGGTLNHFARDRGIPRDLDAALALAAEGRSRRVDVGYVNDQLFLNTSSLGVYVDLARYRGRYRSRLGYTLALALSTALVFVRMRSVDLQVHIHGELLGSPLREEVRAYRTPLLYFGVGERDLSLSGFGARLSGGERGLHMIAIRGKARRRLLAIASATALRGIGTVARTPRVDSKLGQEFLVVVPGDHADVALDGDPHVLVPPLRWRLARGALRVVAPGDHRD